MALLPTELAVELVIYSNLIGWGLAYIHRPKDRGIHPHLGMLAMNLITNTLLAVFIIYCIPGVTHPIYVFAISMLAMCNPYFVLTIDEREPIRGSVKGGLFSYILNSMFMITLLPTLMFLARDFSTYWPLAVVQLGCLASIAITGPAALIHQQQQVLLRRRHHVG